MPNVDHRDLCALVRKAAARAPEAPAVMAEDGALGYGELDRLANRIARALRDLGVGRGDRVGLWLPKSTRGVAVMQGVLRLGAAYVPIDPWSPIARAETIARDCGVRVLVTGAERGDAMAARIDGLRVLTTDTTDTIGATDANGGKSIAPATSGMRWDDLAAFTDTPLDAADNAGGDLAYVLYTSGSTGRPKGVRISHENALAFVEWAGDELRVDATDRLANHAPFHFDLSVFDLYVAQRAGACVVLVPEGLAYSPSGLVDFALRERITVWYSVPSVLALMLDRGGLEARVATEVDLRLRAVLFAGEAFPIKYVKRLRRLLPRARLLNLYGPTETNVCTWFEVGDLESLDDRPLPIGRACSGDRVFALGDGGIEAAIGDEGELFVDGPTVMLGYWGEAAQAGPYATGDIVRRVDHDTFALIGRRDAMLKVRGYRIEPAEIEAALVAHPRVGEAAVAAVGSGLETRLVAFVVLAPGATRPSLLELKRQCAERLPPWMVIDGVQIVPDLPRTSTGKIDRRRLVTEPEPREVVDAAG